MRPRDAVRDPLAESRTEPDEAGGGPETSFHAEELDDESSARKYATEELRASCQAVSSLH